MPFLLGVQVREPGVPGETEVDEHRLPIRSQDDVLGFEIAVHRLLPMQSVHRVRHRGADRARPRRPEAGNAASSASRLSPSTRSMTRYGTRRMSPAATNRGTCGPDRTGTIIASVS